MHEILINRLSNLSQCRVAAERDGDIDRIAQLDQLIEQAKQQLSDLETVQ